LTNLPEMKAFFVDTGAHEGKFNMDYDLRLVANVPPEAMILRFYTWKPYCVSLGANQPDSEVLTDKLTADGFTMVRRPTGGRAVFHSEELTYSVVLRSALMTPRRIYSDVNEALLIGLRHYDQRLAVAELSEKEVKFREHYRVAGSAACFSVPAKAEVKFEEKKLIGSAQRRLGDVTLQHGSINTGAYHKRIVEYLNLSEEEKEEIKNILEAGTSDISEITGEKVDFKKLKEYILFGFSQKFGLNFVNLENMI